MFTSIAITLFLGVGMTMAVIHAESIKSNWNNMVISLANLFSRKGIAELASEFSFADKAPKKCWKCDEGLYEERREAWDDAWAEGGIVYDIFADRMQDEAKGCLGCIQQQKADEEATNYWAETAAGYNETINPLTGESDSTTLRRLDGRL
jgi:hypothetical protein